MSLLGIFGGFETRHEQIFHTFLEPRKKSEIFFSRKNRDFLEKIGILSGNIGIYRKNRRFFSDFFTSDFSTRKSFPAPPKTDFSLKNRSKKTIFLSMIVLHQV